MRNWMSFIIRFYQIFVETASSLASFRSPIYITSSGFEYGSKVAHHKAILWPLGLHLVFVDCVSQQICKDQIRHLPRCAQHNRAVHNPIHHLLSMGCCWLTSAGREFA